MIVEEYKKKAGSAGGCFDYLIIDRSAEQSRASRVADMVVHNLPVMSRVPKTRGEADELVKALTQSMNTFIRNARLTAARPLENRLLHIVISFPPKDTPKLRGICGGPVAVGLELVKNVVGNDRAIAVILHDTSHLHNHTLTSSSDAQGRAWDSSFDRCKWNAGAREIGRKYGLSRLTFDPERHSLSPTERRRLERCGVPDLLDRMRGAICAACSDSPSRDLFERRLENVGITVSERHDEDGKVRGWVFNYREVSIKGSAIHRGLSYRNVTAGLSPGRVPTAPGHEQNVLNVMTLTMSDDEVRQELLRHPQASVRYLAHLATELREGKSGRAWDEISIAAERRLTVRPRLIPVEPEFVKLERAEPMPVSRQRAVDRNDPSALSHHTSQGRDSGSRGRSR